MCTVRPVWRQILKTLRNYIQLKPVKILIQNFEVVFFLQSSLLLILVLQARVNCLLSSIPKLLFMLPFFSFSFPTSSFCHFSAPWSDTIVHLFFKIKLSSPGISAVESYDGGTGRMSFTGAFLLLHLVYHNVQQCKWLDNFIFSTV